MKLLEDRIVKDGIVGAGNVLKVDCFLNHQIDVALISELGKEFYRRFQGEGINKILTIEASGIGIACLTAPYFNVPVVFAKKSKSKNIAGDVYVSKVTSFTHGTTHDIIVSKKFLNKNDRVLIIDDFLARGQALLGLIDLVEAAGATVVGAGIVIEKSHFTQIGASGLCFVGHADSVRNPLFEYNETQSLSEISLEKGPKSENYPKNCTAEDCLIEYVGMVERQASGVEISMAYGVTVKNCTVCHTSRAGINISEGTFGGHRIKGCDVFDTVRETGDHGSFNSWGRDRYWHLRDLDDRDAGKYALLDMLAPNVITRSRFRCDRGWDIDLDDGSSHYIITENLCLNGGIKLREGFFRTVRNNIMVNNTLHTHAWYPESGDVCENNIYCTGYAPYAMPEIWGTRIDGNFLHTPGQTIPCPASELVAVSGQDASSVCLDAGFTAPEESNYIPTHPEIHGFETFPTEFGVRYAPLRALADIPVLPVPAELPRQCDSEIRTIMGMTIKNIDTDGEMSVYATAGHNGVLVLDPSSEAASRGILPNDVIVLWGSREINCMDDLEGLSLEGSTPITVLRKQQSICL